MRILVRGGELYRLNGALSHSFTEHFLFCVCSYVKQDSPLRMRSCREESLAELLFATRIGMMVATTYIAPRCYA